MVTHAVMRVRNADFRVGPIREFPAEHEGRYPRQVCAQGEHLQINHEADVRGEVIRYAGGQLDGVVFGGRGVFAKALDAHFHVAHRGQVFIQLAPVVRAEIARQTAGVCADEVEHARAPAQQRRTGCVARCRRIAEELFKHVAWIHGYGQGLGRRAPGQGVGVRAAEADVAAAEQAGWFDPEFEGAEGRRCAEQIGCALIHGYAVVQIRTLRGLRVRAGEEGRAAAAVGATRITEGLRIGVREAGHHAEAVAQMLKGLERRRHRIVGACGGGPEGVHAHAVRYVEHGQTLRARRARAHARCERLHERQRHARADAAQHRAPGEPIGAPHASGILRWVKGRLRAISRITRRIR